MIQLNNINKVYKTKHNDVHALKDINLSFSETGLVFVLGKSGCGKSTLLNILGCLDRPTSGELIVNDKNISQTKPSELDYFRNYNIGFIFQDYNLVDEYNVYENIELVLNLQGEKDIKDKISNVLEKVGLAGYEKRKINELSGGQQQRVAIARAIIKDTTYILADEPTGNLDSATSEDIFNLLKELSKEKLIIVVTHDRENAEQYGDRIIQMKDGVIVKDDTNSCNDIVANNNSKIDTKIKKMSFKQIFKFALRNMWRRKIRLTATIILSTCCLGLFGFSLSFFRYDCYNKYAPIVNEYKPEYQVMGDFPWDHKEERVELTTIDNSKIQQANNLFGGAMPLYTDGRLIFAVLTEENVDYFPLITFDKLNDRDSIVPQKFDEIVKVNTYPEDIHDYSVARYKECKGIASVAFDSKIDKQRVRQYYQKIKETEYDKNLIGPKTERIKEKTDEELEDELDEIVKQLSIINYFVHPDFVTKILPNRCGENYIKFAFTEWIKDKRTDEEVLYKRECAGYFYSLSIAEKFADEIVYLPQYNGKTKLENDEVIISVNFAKIILGGMEHRLADNVSDSEAKQAVLSGQINYIMLKNDIGLPDNKTIVGYYDASTTEWLNWSDDLFNLFSKYYHSIITTVPFIVSDELYNWGKPVESGCVGLCLNLDNVELNGEILQFMFNEIQGLHGGPFSIMFEFAYYLNLYEHNLNTVGSTFMYIALGAAVLCIIAVLSYIWAVIHDSKHKIGVLRAQGMSNISIALIYLIESLVVCGITILIGSLVAFGFSNWLWLQSILSVEGIIPFTMTNFGILHILSVTGLGLAIGILGAIIPIAINAKKSPVSLIK